MNSCMGEDNFIRLVGGCSKKIWTSRIHAVKYECTKFTTWQLAVATATLPRLPAGCNELLPTWDLAWAHWCCPQRAMLFESENELECSIKALLCTQIVDVAWTIDLVICSSSKPMANWCLCDLILASKEFNSVKISDLQISRMCVFCYLLCVFNILFIFHLYLPPPPQDN